MTRYVFDGGPLLREDPSRYHVVTHDLAARAATHHDVDGVAVKGLVDRLRDRDPEALDCVAAAADADPVGWLDVTVRDPDEAVVDASVRLLSRAVTRFALRAGDATVYARYDDGQVYVALPDDADPGLPGDLADRLHRVERGVEDVTGGEVTEGVLMALMEETPDGGETEDDGEDGDRGEGGAGDAATDGGRRWGAGGDEPRGSREATRR